MASYVATSMTSTTTHTSFQYEDSMNSRYKNRVMDISESYHLLMEVGSQDPVMQHCLKTMQGLCLSQGIHIGNKSDSGDFYDKTRDKSQEKNVKATEEFQNHLEKYFLPFCAEAIRYFFICGFVPWHVRRLKSTGDLVPEIIPLGTFTWHIELRSERQNRKRKESMPREEFATSYVPSIISRREGNAPLRKEDKWHAKWNEKNEMKQESFDTKVTETGIKREMGHPAGSKAVKEDKESQYLQYRVVITAGDLAEDEIYVYDFVPPNYGVCNNSMMYATIPSPVSHLLVDYKNLRQAQIRRAHADAWNTQAHLVTTYKPANTSSDAPTFKGFGYGPSEIDPCCPRADGNSLLSLFDTNGESEVAGRDQLIRRQVMQGKPHDPVVYTLPKYSELESQVDLKPVEDIGFLLEKYSRDVAFLLGIPPNFVVSKTSLTSSNAAAIQVFSISFILS